MIEWIWHADYELLHISIFSNICQAQSTHHSLLKYLPILLRESLDSLSDIVAHKKDIFRTGIYLVNGKKCRINLFACLIWFQSDILDQGWETGELIFIRGSLQKGEAYTCIVYILVSSVDSRRFLLLYACLAHKSLQNLVVVVLAVKMVPQCSHTFFDW